MISPLLNHVLELQLVVDKSIGFFNSKFLKIYIYTKFMPRPSSWFLVLSPHWNTYTTTLLFPIFKNNHSPIPPPQNILRAVASLIN